MHVNKLGKEFGEGVDRMFREMAAADQPEPRCQAVEYIVRATIWQHKVVGKNYSNQVAGKFDQVPEVMAKDFLAKFDAVIAPKYRYASAREQARNNCWKVLMCIMENENVLREGLCNTTGIKPSTFKTVIGYMSEAEIIDFEGLTSNDHMVVKLESAQKS